MLLKGPALQNLSAKVEGGPSLLNFLSNKQIGQKEKKHRYLISALAFSQFSISSRLLCSYEPFFVFFFYFFKWKVIYFFNNTLFFFSCDRQVPLNSSEFKPWKIIFFCPQLCTEGFSFSFLTLILDHVSDFLYLLSVGLFFHIWSCTQLLQL